MITGDLVFAVFVCISDPSNFEEISIQYYSISTDS